MSFEAGFNLIPIYKRPNGTIISYSDYLLATGVDSDAFVPDDLDTIKKFYDDWSSKSLDSTYYIYWCSEFRDFDDLISDIVPYNYEHDSYSLDSETLMELYKIASKELEKYSLNNVRYFRSYTYSLKDDSYKTYHSDGIEVVLDSPDRNDYIQSFARIRNGEDCLMCSKDASKYMFYFELVTTLRVLINVDQSTTFVEFYRSY